MGLISVIITAGGIGKRLGASVPKQFVPLNDQPLLMYTLSKFYHYDPSMQLILTLPEEWIAYWDHLVQEQEFRIPHRVVTGGNERFDSVNNALEYCMGDVIAIHDGVRPLVSQETLDRCFAAVRTEKAVIPVLPVLESLRIKDKQTSKSVNRDDYMLVQTPQCFEAKILRAAYAKAKGNRYSDDATLVEESGQEIHWVEGNRENIKITTSFDIHIARHLLK